jgi:hypothetical protein
MKQYPISTFTQSAPLCVLSVCLSRFHRNLNLRYARQHYQMAETNRTEMRRCSWQQLCRTLQPSQHNRTCLHCYKQAVFIVYRFSISVGVNNKMKINLEWTVMLRTAVLLCGKWYLRCVVIIIIIIIVCL